MTIAVAASLIDEDIVETVDTCTRMNDVKNIKHFIILAFL